MAHVNGNSDSSHHDKADIEIAKVSILGRESIHLGFHLVPYIVRTLLAELPSSAYVLVTDLSLANLYLQPFADEFAAQLEQSGRASSSRLISYQVSPGEGSKSRKTKEEIEDWLLSQRCTRDTVILALGGGVVGDLTGFVAATFMRGVKFCQIPTTLLAMVDSAVGGKVGLTNHLLRLFPRKQAEMFSTPTLADRNRYTPREEPHRSIPPAILHLHRCCFPRDASRA